jgi:glycosyltransferase involved in cell wall biosynthesis
MNNVKTSIIIPTRGRHHLLPGRLKELLKLTPELEKEEAELIIVMDEDEEANSDTYTSEFNCRVVFTPKLEFPAKKWNLGARYSIGEWLVTMSDDSRPLHDKWLYNALNETINHGFLGLPDEMGERNTSYFTPIYMATREWLKKYNGGVLVIPMYGIWYADIETCERAHKSGTYAVSYGSQVRQLHADFATAPDDEIYRIGKSRRVNDKIVFDYRKRNGFPDDFERCLD